MPNTPTPGQVVFEGRWCVIVRLERQARRKTDRFHVVTKEGCDIVGEVRWYAPWRKYALCPKAETVWEEVCLFDVSMWMADETARHRRRSA